MPIVTPRLNLTSQLGAVSKAFTRSGPSLPVVPGVTYPTGAGWTGSSDWMYGGKNFSPAPKTMEADGYMSRLDRVERVFLSEIDAHDLDMGPALVEVTSGQTINVGGVAGSIGAVSMWHWPTTQPWRASNVSFCFTLAAPIDLHLLTRGLFYTVSFS